MTFTVSCPTCSKKIEWTKDALFKPFCSERCKLIDLGDWASEKHAIAGEPAYVQEDQQYTEE